MDNTPTNFVQALVKEGSIHCMDGHTSHILDDQERVLFVERGRVEVFAAPISEAGPSAMRRHLFSIDAGGVLMGLPEGMGGVQVIATARVDTRLIEVSTEVFQAQAEQQDHHQLAAKALDQWIVGLGLGTVRHVFPKPAATHLLVSGMSEMASQGAVLKVRRNVVWVELPEASAMFADIEPVPLPGPAFFPLAGDAWLKLHEDVSLNTVDTTQALSNGDCWNGLAGLHEAVMNCLPINLSLAEVDEVNRLKARSRHRETKLAGMVDNLARLIGVTKNKGAQAQSGEHLFLAASMVIKSIGGKPNLPVKISQSDADVPATLDEIAHASSMRYREVDISGEWWSQDYGPLLAYKKDGGDPVALLPRMKGGYRLYDPEGGQDVVADGDIGFAIAPKAHVFFKHLADKKLAPHQLIFFGLQQSGWDMTSSLAGSFLGALIGMAVPITTGFIFNAIIPGHLTSLLYQVGAALAVLGIASALFKTVVDVSMLRIQARTGARLKAAMWDRVLRFPLSFLRNQTAGNMAARMGAMEGFQMGVRSMLQILSWSFGMVLSSFVVLFWFDWRAGLVVAALIFLLALITGVFAVLQYRAFIGGEAAAGLVDSYVLEMITGIAKIRMAAAEDRVLVNWGERFTKLRSKLIRARQVTNAHTAFLAGYNILTLTGVFAVIALLNEDPLTTGAFLAFVAAFSTAMLSAQQMAQTVLGLSFQLPMVKFFQPLLDTLPQSNAKKANPGTLSGRIEVNNIFFRYTRDGPPVLAGVNLKIEPGEFLAVVGPSGCGKSSLVRILLGLEAAQSGAVFFDGRDLRGLDQDAVRRQVGTVLQNTKLMPGSLFENIRGATDCSLEDAWEAARAAGIDADIEAMPMGMQTIITEASRSFSGGQIQRIAIARAIVHRPPILIFDEATSALDNETQAGITQKLEQLSTTRLIIAHRLSTIRNADRIIVLKDGQLVEQGTYSELMDKKRVFYSLAMRQMA